MAKRKIKGDGENKNQVMFGLNHGIIKGWKALQDHQVQASTKSHHGHWSTKGHECSVLGWWLPPPWAWGHGSAHSFHEKMSPKSRKRAHHYCQISSVIHALVWGERGALQGQGTGVGRSWEQTQQISALSLWRMECGPEAFSKVSPSALKCPSSSGSGSCQWDISREQRHQCPNFYSNRGAPGLPAHPQESHSELDLKSHSSGRGWRALLSVQGKMAQSWLCSLPGARHLREGWEQGDFWMV